jgi:hypothetical protein
MGDTVQMSSDRRKVRPGRSAFAKALQSGGEQAVNSYLRARCDQQHNRRPATRIVPQVQLVAAGVWMLRTTACSVGAAGRIERRGT